MRLLLGVVTSLLTLTALTTVATPAQAVPATPASAARAGVDPSAVTAIQAAVRRSYGRGWGRAGGTYVEECAYAAGHTLRWRSRLDRRTRTWAGEMRGSDLIPSVTVGRGPRTYLRAPRPVRVALQVHGAPRAPRWIDVRRWDDQSSLEQILPDGDYFEDAGVWSELTMTANPSGGKTFRGILRDTNDGRPGTAVVFETNAGGRLVGATSRTPGRTPEAPAEQSCAESWDWARPKVKLPRKAGAYAQARYRWEDNFVSRFHEVAAGANRLLAAGASEAEAVAWVHTRYSARWHTARGLLLVVRARDRGEPAVTFELEVSGGRASYRAVPEARPTSVTVGAGVTSVSAASGASRGLPC